MIRARARYGALALLVASSAIPFLPPPPPPPPAAATAYWTSGTPGAQSIDQMDITLAGTNSSTTIGDVKVWDGTAPEPTGSDWNSDATTNVSTVTQTLNDAPASGDWKNIGSNQISKPKFWFGDDIPEAGKVRVCISYTGTPPTVTFKDWKNHN